ncbi:hypothetical protein JRO89_XS12G0229900 [Xanthoceras sorbifolium]|uniref:Calmodulin-binding domain-containing protein n=1 Tax=Xanthoceras sorbifolium TaxID=99658 RepID=A0ABQ8HDF2_9ROSI|nr:hypothetical protein JRO89_XS12G0229900 [Xanthoceras sorbifolium]
MAEESSDLSVTPEITKPYGGNSRRNSLGKGGSSNSEEKVIPNYLRASTGSCHDLCKYGTKHAFRAKARQPIPRRVAKEQPGDQSPTTSMILPERKKKTLDDKPKPSRIAKTSFTDIPEVIKREVPTKSPEVLNMNTSQDNQDPLRIEVFSGKKKTSAAKLKPSPNSKARISESPSFEKQEASMSYEVVEVSSKRTSSKSKETNVSAKCASSLKPKSVQQPKSSPDLSRGLSDGRNSEIKIGKRTGAPRVTTKKVLASPRASLAVPRVSLAVPRASLSSKASNSRVKKTSLSPGPSISKVSRLSLSPGPSNNSVSRASLSPKPSLSRGASINGRKHKSQKVVPPMKIQGKVKKSEPDQSKIELKQVNKDLLQEKTLYVIKMETENKPLESDQNERCAVESSPAPSSSLPESLPISPSSSLQKEEDQEKFEYTETEAEDDSLSESDYDGTMSEEEEEEDMGDVHHGRPRKSGIVHSEGKDSEAVKVHFRRGKIVDVQSENNGPRRLKFRRGRVLGENIGPKADGRRSFKKRGVDGEKNDGRPGSEKVVLRHQDVQGKKDSQILFNNVIEQTASKLVETRKSKVKALVGAFETVISLQESKPSANTTT